MPSVLTAFKMTAHFPCKISCLTLLKIVDLDYFKGATCNKIIVEISKTMITFFYLFFYFFYVKVLFSPEKMFFVKLKAYF